jgi:hypothetical protein
MLDVVEVYDPATDTWSEHAPMPSPIRHHSICVVGGKLYLIGGSTTAYPPTATSAILQYDPGPTTIEALGWGVIKAMYR